MTFSVIYDSYLTNLIFETLAGPAFYRFFRYIIHLEKLNTANFQQIMWWPYIGGSPIAKKRLIYFRVGRLETHSIYICPAYRVDRRFKNHLAGARRGQLILQTGHSLPDPAYNFLKF